MTAVRPRIAWPIVIDATNDTFEITVNGAGGGTITKSIAQATYNTPEALILAFAAQVNAAVNGFTGGWTATAALNATGQVVLAVNTGPGRTFTFPWTGNAIWAALGSLLGFNTSIDTPAPPAISTFTTPYQVRNLWLPNTPVRSDSKENRAFSRAVVESSGGVVGIDFAELRRRQLAFEKLPANKVFTANESLVNEAVQHLWENGAAGFLWWDDATSTGLSGTPAAGDVGSGRWYALEEQAAQAFRPKRAYDGLTIYDLPMSLVGSQ